MFPNLGVRGSRSVCFHDRLILDVSVLTLFFRAISASFFLVTFFLVISPCFFRFFLFKCGLEPRSLVFEILNQRFSGVLFFKNSFSRILFGTISYFSFSEIIFGVIFHSFWFSDVVCRCFVLQSCFSFWFLLFRHSVRFRRNYSADFQSFWFSRCCLTGLFATFLSTILEIRGKWEFFCWAVDGSDSFQKRSRVSFWLFWTFD